ncbi:MULTISPECIES: hypothetical protein [unclassified Saccharopolyspora]|uniref:hypothetical protein n=1 Tax=Saccharopolyspora TaxID=1835 RepID=UPI00190CB46D|nr:hypothetical protein [Saccharopolyspora sp. HNM0986]MBK0866161.1 hypothetical protein [Saccharopolyspora sp. HNM0986]
MAKQSFPMPGTSGGGLLPKVLGTLVTLAVVTLVVKDPVGAAHLAGQLAGFLGTVVTGLATFLQNVLG